MLCANYATKFNFDLDAIFEDLERSEAEHIAHRAKFIALASSLSNISHSIYQKIRFGHSVIKIESMRQANLQLLN